VLARPDAVGVLGNPSFAFTARLIDASIGTVGDALDNALMESACRRPS
jgi:hypothetical protein